jgi:Zn finger protein HypA/HybF involved in hydrogenase expression
MATCQCPKCNKRFQVLDDEYGDHPCPNCGYGEEPEKEYVECELCEWSGMLKTDTNTCPHCDQTGYLHVVDKDCSIDTW